MKRANPLVLVFHTASRAYWNDIVAGITAFAKTAGWNLQVVENELESRTIFRDLTKFWKPDGCIFEDSIDMCTSADIRAVEDISTVFVNCERTKRSRGVCSIAVNSLKIGELAARELMSADLSGFAFYGFSEFRWSDERQEGFERALKMNGWSCQKFCRPFKAGGRANRSDVVRWLRGLPKPCGIFAANDLLSGELLNVCLETGLNVPDDICILGVDNDAGCCENTRPTLSSINPDFLGEGFAAASALSQLMRGVPLKPSCDDCCLPTVVRRQSTRRMGKHASDIAAALEFIRVNACDGLSSKDVFPLFSCTRRRVEQRFRAELGHSVLDEINAVRISRAEDLLARTDQTLESIASECGFHSVPYLRTLFKRMTGVSLSEARSRAQPARFRNGV